MMLALVAAAGASETDQRMARMTALYEQACITAFPDDKAVEALMKARNATELSPADVKITMRDDPARGWDLQDGGASLWIEFPPYHACSVRWNTTGIGDLTAYRAITAIYEKLIGGFQPVRPYDADQGQIHVHAVGEQRTLANKGTESLFIFDQQINDAKRREAGETGVVLRFVHQFAPPPSDEKK